MENITEIMWEECLRESVRYEAQTSTVIRERSQWFTPTQLALDILKRLPSDVWKEHKTFVDPECGIGQQLVPVAIIKMMSDHKNILHTIFGVDINENNVTLCRGRLLDVCGHTKENIKLVNKNIVCADSLTYNFEFN